jgi:hypothetical protein
MASPGPARRRLAGEHAAADRIVRDRVTAALASQMACHGLRTVPAAQGHSQDRRAPSREINEPEVNAIYL